MLRQLDIILYTLTKDEYIGEGSSKCWGGGGHKVLVVVITPFGVLLLVYKADAPRARKRPRARPQQHDKMCDNVTTR